MVSRKEDKAALAQASTRVDDICTSLYNKLDKDLEELKDTPGNDRMSSYSSSSSQKIAPLILTKAKAKPKALCIPRNNVSKDDAESTLKDGRPDFLSMVWGAFTYLIVQEVARSLLIISGFPLAIMAFVVWMISWVVGTIVGGLICEVFKGSNHKKESSCNSLETSKNGEIKPIELPPPSMPTSMPVSGGCLVSSSSLTKACRSAARAPPKTPIQPQDLLFSSSSKPLIKEVPPQTDIIHHAHANPASALIPSDRIEFKKMLHKSNPPTFTDNEASELDENRRSLDVDIDEDEDDDDDDDDDDGSSTITPGGSPPHSPKSHSPPSSPTPFERLNSEFQVLREESQNLLDEYQRRIANPEQRPTQYEYRLFCLGLDSLGFAGDLLFKIYEHA